MNHYPIQIGSDTGDLQAIANKKGTMIGAAVGAVVGYMLTEKSPRIAPIATAAVSALFALVGSSHDS